MMCRVPLALLLATAAACGSDDPPDDPGEVITTVILTFEPLASNPISFEADDPDGDGGDPPVIDPIVIAPGSYTLSLRFQNRLEDPAEEITDEIRDEADEHQVFFTGTAVDGPAANNPGAPLAHAYNDADADGNPIGLANTITATAGTGQLVVTLRHLPPVSGNKVKVAGLADQVKAGGLGAIGGDTDASVTFPVTVQE
jgi:hypothetical protein